LVYLNMFCSCGVITNIFLQGGQNGANLTDFSSGQPTAHIWCCTESGLIGSIRSASQSVAPFSRDDVAPHFFWNSKRETFTNLQFIIPLHK
jgi:hypothetical protein